MKAFTLDSKNLNQILKAFKGVAVAKVGILGQKNARKKSAQKTNAEIGAIHEFGLNGIERSFLRVPISDHLQAYIEKAGKIKPAMLKEIVREGTSKPWARKLGIIGEQIVADAFDSGGFGKWKQSDMSRKKVKQTLVETQQLRNSISSEVVE